MDMYNGGPWYKVKTQVGIEEDPYGHQVLIASEMLHVGQLTQCCDVSYINLQDGTRSNVSLHLGEYLLRWVHPQLTSLRATHLPGLYNNAAGTLSRRAVSATRSDSLALEKVWQGIGGLLHQGNHCTLWFSIEKVNSLPV